MFLHHIEGLRKNTIYCLLLSLLCASSMTAQAATLPSNIFLKQTPNPASENTTTSQTSDSNTTEATLTDVDSDTQESMRGIYVATVLNLDYPSIPTTDKTQLQTEIDDIINTCSSLGFNTIFLQVRPCADAIYPSAIFPWSRYLTGSQSATPEDGFDPLAYYIEKAHNAGMELHAWINPYRITKKTTDWVSLSDTSPAKLHPEWVVRYLDGNYYFDPAIPEVRQLIVNGVAEIIQNYDVDGIHLDDYFYPGTDFPDDASFVKYNTANYFNKADWRRYNVDTLIQALNTMIHEYDPELSFGISPSGVWDNLSTNPLGSDTKSGNPSYSRQYADTRKWALEGWVDYIAPQIYWENGHLLCDYETLLTWWSTTLADCDTSLYISMADYRANEVSVGNVWYGGAELLLQLTQNKENDIVAGELHYRYRSLLTNPALQNVVFTFYQQDTNSSSIQG